MERANALTLVVAHGLRSGPPVGCVEFKGRGVMSRENVAEGGRGGGPVVPDHALAE